MSSYELILKLMRMVDRRDPHRPGLPLKDIITIDDIRIGLFESADLADRNVMGFTVAGEHLWTIDHQPDTPERFSRAWRKIMLSDDGTLTAIGSDGVQHQVDHRTGNLRRPDGWAALPLHSQ